MWFTIEQILTLKALNDFGSINAASEHLNKAKSAVSYSIEKLEEQLGFEVLDRSQYRTHLSEKGKNFLYRSQNLMKEWEALKEEVQKIASGVEMKLSLSATAIYPTNKLNPVLQGVIEKFPSTEFIFHREILSGEKMLLTDQVDIGIFESLQNTVDIEGKKIGSTCLKLVICQNHPFLDLPKKEQTMSALARYPHIIQRSTISDSQSFGPKEEAPRWTVSDIDSKKDLILNNFGWGRLPEDFVTKELKSKKLVHLDHLNYDHKLDIFICRKKNKNFGPVHNFIWNSF